MLVPVEDGTPSNAQSEDAVDRFIESVMANDQLPSVAVIVGRGGERLFKPLVLQSTVLRDADGVIPGAASMYELQEGRLRPRRSLFPEFARGAAGVNTSVIDWYRWSDAWAHARIIPQEELELMWTPTELTLDRTVSIGPGRSYGCGVMVGVHLGKRSVGHSGGGSASFRFS